MVQTILVPLDGSKLAEQALPHAEALAHTLEARLILARVPETLVVPVMSGGIWVTREIESNEAQERALRYVEEVAARPGLQDLQVETATPHHPVAAGLIKTIEETDSRLVVMTTHGHSGIGRWVFGSVADKMIHAAPTPLYLVRAQQTRPAPPQFLRVVVPLDGSELAEAALPSATELARATGAAISLVRVPTLPVYVTAVPETAGWIPDLLRETALEAKTYLTEQAESLRSSGLDVSSDVELVVSGGVAEGIMSFARQQRADVIVMSTHGRSGLGRWVFGSVADRVLRAADIPIWLVRAGIASTAA